MALECANCGAILELEDYVVEYYDILFCDEECFAEDMIKNLDLTRRHVEFEDLEEDQQAKIMADSLDREVFGRGEIECI